MFVSVEILRRTSPDESQNPNSSAAVAVDPCLFALSGVVVRL